MCIAILKTKDGNITDEQLRNCFRKNKDGAGIAYTINDELYLVKGIFDIEEFVKTVREAEKVADNNMLIHCRITTSGNIDELNCHPHVLNEKMVMIHNGILHIDVPKESKVSDTIIFCNKYLKQFRNTDLIHNLALKEMLEEFIGAGNKFVFLNNLGEYNIINEDQGHWSDGVWYSNYSYVGYSFYGYDEDDYAYGCYGYRYTNEDYTWNKQAKAEVVEAVDATEDAVEIAGTCGRTITLDAEDYAAIYYEVEQQIDEATDSELDLWGESPQIDMYDYGVIYTEHADYDDDGMAYLANVFPELYAKYRAKYDDYVQRMLIDETLSEV